VTWFENLIGRIGRENLHLPGEKNILTRLKEKNQNG